MAMAERPEYWVAWLVNGAGKHAGEALNLIETEINNRQIPEVGNRERDEGISVKKSTVNMWWRSSTPALKMKSRMDGDVEAEIAAQDYGSSLYVYLMIKGVKWDEGWAKRMHFQAFRWSLNSAVEDALDRLPDNPTVSIIKDIPEQ